MKNKRRSKTIKMNEGADDLEDIDMNEIVDSEEEYTQHERKLLKKVQERDSSDSYDSDYEVYGLHKENESDQNDAEDVGQTDSMESDIEGLAEDIDLPNEKAWGKKKKAYYSTDYVDPDYAVNSHKELAEAEMEEEEARNIQKRLAEQLDDADFGLDIIETGKDNEQKVDEDTEQFIKADLSKLSKRQKQAIMQKESPEFVALVNDFKACMSEVKDLLIPFLKFVKDGILPNCAAVSFIKTKYYLFLNYAINISFYLMLKAKRLPVSSHPVIKRLAQYRQMINQLESGQGNLIQEIQEILKAKKQGKPLYNLSDGIEVNIDEQMADQFKDNANYLTKSTSELGSLHSLESEVDVGVKNSQFADEYLNNETENKIENANANSTLDNADKRAITYQIAKNKGLTPHRKKEQRNPRVKHRNKYRKAKIRRKGAVREVRKELNRYSGEISGIKAGVKKSIKLK